MNSYNITVVHNYTAIDLHNYLNYLNFTNPKLINNLILEVGNKNEFREIAKNYENLIKINSSAYRDYQTFLINLLAYDIYEYYGNETKAKIKNILLIKQKSYLYSNPDFKKRGVIHSSFIRRLKNLNA